MKRKAEFIVPLLICLTLAGCFGGTEVNERAFVQLMGIQSDDGVYTVDLQLYKGESSDGNPDISKANSDSVSGSGATLSAALSDAELKAGKSLYIGHIKLLILGEGIKDPAEELSPLTVGGSSAGVISPSCPVVYCSSPDDITSLKMEQGLYSADRLMQIMDTYVKSGKCVYTSYASLAESTSLNGASSPLPVIKASDKSAFFDGLVFAAPDGIHSGLPEEDTAGVIILNGDFAPEGHITIPVTVGEKTASAVITEAKIRRSADISEGKLRINAKINLELDIIANPDNLTAEEISSAACGNVRDSCISAYSASAWYGGYDIFGVYRLIRRDCPSLLKADRETVLKESILNISVKAVCRKKTD